MPSKELNMEYRNEVTLSKLLSNQVVSQDKTSRKLGNGRERWNKKLIPNLNRQVILEKRWGNAQDMQTYFAMCID